MRKLFWLLAILFTSQSHACRVVCGDDQGIWHLVGQASGIGFKLIRGTKGAESLPDIEDLACALHSVDEEHERLLNHCEGLVDGGKVVVRTEIVNRQRLNPRTRGTETVDAFTWVIETGGPKPTATRREFLLSECGSSEGR